MTEDCGRFLARVLEEQRGGLPKDLEDEDGWDAVALAAVKQARESRATVPGLGHPVHKERDPRTARLTQIPGAPPSLLDPPTGCRFAPRCSHVFDECVELPPLEARTGDAHLVRCWLDAKVKALPG